MGAALLCAGLTAACNPRQKTTQGEPQPHTLAKTAGEAAQQALGDLQELVTGEGDFTDYGFASADEVSRARLGDPIGVYDIALEALRKYDGGDVEKLLIASPRLIYPVLVGDVVKSSVAVVRASGGYRPSSLGETEVALAVSRFRTRGAGSGEFVVRAPVQNLLFLGRRTPEGFGLLALFDNDVGLPVGVWAPAGNVLKTLVPAARDYDGSPS